MNSLTKKLGIALLSLLSLTGCMKSYRVNKEIISYNKYLSTPMVIYTDSAKISYSTSWTYPSSLLYNSTGKDITGMSIAKARKPLFKTRSIKYSHFPKRFSGYNPDDSAMIKRGREDFDKHKHIIDSIDNLR